MVEKKVFYNNLSIASNIPSLAAQCITGQNINSEWSFQL